MSFEQDEVKELVATLEYQLKHGLTKEEAVKKLQKAYPDHPIEVVVYQYRRKGNSMSCQKPIVMRSGEIVAPLVSVDVSNENQFSGPRFQPAFSSNYRRSEMIWVIEPGDLIDYRYPYAS